MNTRSSFAYIKKKREFELINKEVERIINALCSIPNIKERAITKVAKRLLIRHNSLIANGVSYSTHSKYIGAGVHEIFLKAIE